MKSKKVVGIVLAQALFANYANAIFIDRGEVPRATVRTNASGSGIPSRPLDAAGTSSVATPGTPALVCNKHTVENYLSLGFLYNLVDFPEDITLKRTDRNTVIVKIPKHVSACMQLDFEFRNVGNDKIVAMKNAFRFTAQNTGFTEAELSGKTHDEKYAACLKEKKLLIETGPEQYAFDRAEAERTQQVAYSVETEFPLNLADESKSMKLFFASPKASSYATVYDTNNVPESPREWPCLATEKFEQQDPYLYISQEDRLAQSAMVACESNDYEKILKELRELRRSSAGNAIELISILESALESARDKRLEEIHERFEAIEREFAPTREDIANNRNTGVSENRARVLGKEYAGLLEEVNRILYDPGIQEINRLMTELDSGNSTDARKTQINARVKTLNEKIGRFATKDQRNLGRVFDGLKEYGLNNEALRIEGFRLKSQNFSKVAPEGEGRSRVKPLTIAQADENIKKSLQAFENITLKTWDDQYRVKQGDNTPILMAQRQSQQRWASMQRQYQQFMQREQSEMQRHCATGLTGVRNPMACQRHMAGQQQRQQQFAQRWQTGLNQIQADSQRVAELNQTYEEAMREIASLRGPDQPGFGDDPFGFYTNPYDNSYLYSVGGPQFNQNVMNMNGPAQSPMMNQGGMMGQPQMYSPQLQAPTFGY